VADTVFQTTNPPVKAVDQGDGTYAMSCTVYDDTGIYTTFPKTFPTLRAMWVENDAEGNPVYAMACEAQ